MGTGVTSMLEYSSSGITVSSPAVAEVSLTSVFSSSSSNGSLLSSSDSSSDSP